MNIRLTILAPALLALAGSPLMAAPVADQSAAYSGSGKTTLGTIFTDLAQSFTVGVDGALSAIDLLVARDASTTNALTLSLRRMTGDRPDPDDANNLGTVSLAADMVNVDDMQTLRFDLSALDVTVEAGDQLAFSLYTDERGGTFKQAYSIATMYRDVYAGGERHYRRSYSENFAGFGREDLAFTTYVDTAAPVPLPAAAPLLIAALGGLAWLRRRG